MKENMVDDQNIKNSNEKCYVFSDKTLTLAMQEWFEIEHAKNPKQAENLEIAATALPWFLANFKQSGSIKMFTQDDLFREMEFWKSAQIKDYPHQEKRIDECCTLLLEFFQSDLMFEHKMLIEA